MTERVEIRPPIAQRIYLVAFGIFWCGFLAVTIVATHSATSIVPLIMIAIGATMFYRVFQLLVLLRNGEIMILDVTIRPWFFGKGPAKLESYLTSLRGWLR